MARKGQGIEIVSGWQAGLGGEDFLRGLVERTVQQVLEAEMTSFIGAETYQRNDVRRGWRNGYKPRTLKTRIGGLELMVPKDRDGEFQTELFERYQRSEKAFVAALLQMYVEGVSTRKVTAITEALCGLEVSKSQVSALTQKLDAEVAEWRSRPLTEEYPYLIFDARYEKVRRGGSVVSQGVLVVVGIGADGYREVLGAWVAESESEASWGAVFAELKQRGLRGVRYLVSDDHVGMVKAIGRHFQHVAWQRCQVHFVRNALSLCGVQQRPLVLRLLKTVTEAPTRECHSIALITASVIRASTSSVRQAGCRKISSSRSVKVRGSDSPGRVPAGKTIRISAANSARLRRWPRAMQYSWHSRLASLSSAVFLTISAAFIGVSVSSSRR